MTIHAGFPISVPLRSKTSITLLFSSKSPFMPAYVTEKEFTPKGDKNSKTSKKAPPTFLAYVFSRSLTNVDKWVKDQPTKVKDSKTKVATVCSSDDE